jgi:hypothetical protein
MSSVPGEPVKEAARPPHPDWWVAPPHALPTAVGLNRTNWDLRFDAPPAFSHSFEINANPGLTPTTPEGIIAAQGTYTIKLNVDGRSFSQKVTITNDPRSPATGADVRAQYALLRKINDGVKAAWDGYQQVETMRAALKTRAPSDTTADVAKAIRTFRAKVDTTGGNAALGGPPGARRPPANFYQLNARLVGQLTAHDNADQAPTESMQAAFAQACRDLQTAAVNWSAINAKDLLALNSALTKGGLQPIAAAPGVKAPACGEKPAR